jgi:hypothetical protein
MKHIIKQVLNEELTRSDKAEIKNIFKSEFNSAIKTNDVKKKIGDMVKNQLKTDKPTRREVGKMTQKVLVKLFKTFWVRKNIWSNNLENV